MFEIIVVGKGLIGSAAFRYLSAKVGNVALVGPNEPVDWQQHQGVFASHYDQGRLTRILDVDPIWAQLAQRSLATYAEIEQRSGIQFHFPVTGLRVVADGSSRIAAIETVGAELDVDYRRLTAAEAKTRFPFFDFPTDAQILWEKAPAGYINPRRMVAAQMSLAEGQGGCHIPATVASLKQYPQYVEMTTDKGQLLQGRKVLLALGAYTNMLLPERPLRYVRRAERILLAEVDRTELARLKQMPALIYNMPAGSALNSLYMIPPVRYPDGRTYLKVGSGHIQPVTIFERWDEIVDWFHGDRTGLEKKALQAVLGQTIPDLKVQSYVTKPCLLAFTPHDHPYIGQLDETRQLYVAAGGSGAAAKSADEIGRLAALQVLQRQWPDGFEPMDFEPLWA